MNPLGMAFESYDDVGRFRESELLRDNETTTEVDASGYIPILDVAVKDALDLGHLRTAHVYASTARAA